MDSPSGTSSASRLVLTSSLMAAALAFVWAAVPGCGAGTRKVARTVTTSASIEAQSRSASTRTIDNAGFVDNGGRTSSETARTEMSGMRASEVGSERPTGTPSTGLVVPYLDVGTAGLGNEGEGAGAASSVRGRETITPTGAPDDEVVARVTRARCDHAITCGRVADDRLSGPAGSGASAGASLDVGQSVPVHPSDSACMAYERALTQTDVARAQCSSGVDAVQLAACLTAIRGQPCDPSLGVLEDVPGCGASALCAPP